MMRAGFSRHFQETFAAYVGTRILVALSGGPDSVALLHLLRDPALRLELHAAHIHHGVRGAEADGDAAFCRRLCGELGLPFHMRRLVPPESPPEGREAAWRRLRYAALHEIAATVGARAIVTGHQRDDIAEGVLVQLLRGAGPRAMAGIAAEAEGPVLRPLLPWGRREILHWLEDHGIAWREDSSNRSPEHLRNRVRSELLPRLGEVEPRVRNHLVLLAEDLARDEGFFAAELGRLDLWIDPWHPEGGIELARLAALHPALLRRWLHSQVARAGLGRATRRQGELLEELILRGEPRAVALAGRWRLYRARGRLWLEPPVSPPPYSSALVPGSTVELPLPGWRVHVGAAGRTGLPDQPAAWRRLVPDVPRLAVRSPLPGDMVAARGGRRRLAPLLSRHLPRHLRAAWPVIHVGATIVWVPGVWTPPTPEGEDVLQVEVARQ
ncbi:MAG: tRNA lysidine(34) synthetase TilS [Acidobacteria bacterium]|nr:tRNA lysidine(34) synthetase TilS [Acidobacteriota bacterium]